MNRGCPRPGTQDTTFGLFYEEIFYDYEEIFYDNLAHFLTSFALVALAAELAQHHEALPVLVSGRRSLMAGALVGFVGGGAWEIVEIIADFAFPVFIYNPPLETAIDMAFGTVGEAGGAWRTNAVYTTPKPTRLWHR